MWFLQIVQGGCLFRFNFSEVYWNSKLQVCARFRLRGICFYSVRGTTSEGVFPRVRHSIAIFGQLLLFCGQSIRWCFLLLLACACLPSMQCMRKFNLGWWYTVMQSAGVLKRLRFRLGFSGPSNRQNISLRFSSV